MSEKLIAAKVKMLKDIIIFIIIWLVISTAKSSLLHF